MDFRSNEADRIAPRLPIRRCHSNRFPSDLSPFFVVAMPLHGKWSLDMDYAKPADVVASMIDASQKKLAWRGMATEKLSDKKEKLVKQVNTAVEKMFQRYPAAR